MVILVARASDTPTTQRIRAAGLRVTAPRIAVLEVLGSRRDHFTADRVHDEVTDRLGKVSLQAVYDVLAALTESGLVRRIETPGHPARFEDRVGDNHHHFVCRSCGDTVDIDCATGSAPCLDPASLPHGFSVDEAEVTYWGVCSACALSPALADHDS